MKSTDLILPHEKVACRVARSDVEAETPHEVIALLDILQPEVEKLQESERTTTRIVDDRGDYLYLVYTPTVVH